jgi:pimeloyl-ACP methyl ester carboxylesterase
MRHPARLLAVAFVLLIGAAALAGTASAAALTFAPCHPALAGFRCATLRVPLDHSGAVPGTLRLRVARQVRAPRGAQPLVSLSGGPGQEAVPFAPGTAQVLAPARSRYRLVLLDQRGTGASGVLRCPALQRARSLDVDVATLTAACAARIGAKRAFYSTADSVDDLESLRVALGARKLALQGTSYGTYVAGQFARTYPTRIDRLVLDSSVGPGGVPPLLTDSWSALPRILGEICGAGRCRGITADLTADVRALAAQLEARPLRGTVLDGRGRPVAQRLTAVGLAAVLQAGDLNPHLQAALPAAIRSALDGRPRPLLRLVLPTLGAPLATRELSLGLNVTTTCLDTRLSFPLPTPLPDRPGLAAAALAATPEAALGPFSRPLVARLSVDEQCRLWPVQPDRPQSTAPYPAGVPTLILGGSLDIRTPVENDRELQAAIPGAQFVRVPGSGHDEIDSDLNGCVRRALARFFADRRVGAPCTRSFQVPPQPIAPASLAATPRAAGVTGDRGRVLTAAVGAVNDTRESFVEAETSGLRRRTGGGLVAGWWEARGENGFALRGVGWVPGVRVTGDLQSTLGRYSGRVRVRAPHGLGGTLRFDPATGVTGRLGGRAVHLPARAVRGAVPIALQHARPPAR